MKDASSRTLLACGALSPGNEERCRNQSNDRDRRSGLPCDGLESFGIRKRRVAISRIIGDFLADPLRQGDRLSWVGEFDLG